MPRRAKAGNESSQSNLTTWSAGPHGGVQTYTTAHTNEDDDTSMADHQPGPSNPLRSTTARTPHPSRTTNPAQTTSSQQQHPQQGQVRDKLDISPESKQTRKDMLREAFFAEWNHDASSADLGNPDDMQKNDPLGTQIWKLYSKTKTQLPNQERMENLTWRMMSMNIKRLEREQARYVMAQVAHTERSTRLIEAICQSQTAAHEHTIRYSTASRIERSVVRDS